MAEFISNSAILATIHHQCRAYGGAQLRPRARKMAVFGIKSAISTTSGRILSVCPLRTINPDVSGTSCFAIGSIHGVESHA